MLIVGYAFGIRSERVLCRDVAVNLAYRWFCGLSIEDKVPDHSVFSRARHERFRESDATTTDTYCVAVSRETHPGPAALRGRPLLDPSEGCVPGAGRSRGKRNTALSWALVALRCPEKNTRLPMIPRSAS